MSWIRGLLLWWNGVDPAARASKAMGIEGFRMFAMGIESLETQDRSLILQVQDIFKKEVELAAMSEDVTKWLARSCTQSWHCCTPCHMLRQGFSISSWLEEARPLFQAHWFDRFIMFDPSTGSTAKTLASLGATRAVYHFIRACDKVVPALGKNNVVLVGKVLWKSRAICHKRNRRGALLSGYVTLFLMRLCGWSLSPSGFHVWGMLIDSYKMAFRLWFGCLTALLRLSCLGISSFFHLLSCLVLVFEDI